MPADGKEVRSLAALAALLRGIGEFAQMAGSHSAAPTFTHIPPSIRQAISDAQALVKASLLDIAWRVAAGAASRVSPTSLKLFAPLSRVVFDDRRSHQQVALPFKKLNFDETLISRETRDGSVAELFADLVDCADSITADSLDCLIQTLLAVIETNGWCVPAEAGSTISVFEQSRAAAGIAAALAAEPEDAISHSSELTLAVGDLGGIQRFLYTSVASKAARMLRGRSLALQLMADAIAHRILDRFDLPVTNVLYSGGGKLWLLMPSTAEDSFHEVAEAIDLELSRMHGGRLSFAVGCATASLAEFAAAVPEIWRQASTNLGLARRTRFSRALVHDGYERVFGKSENFERVCRVCGSPSADLKPLSRDDDDREREACEHCRDFVKLGGCSTKTRVIVRARQALPVHQDESVEFVPFAGGDRYYLYADIEIARRSSSAASLMWLHQTPEFWDGCAGHVIWPAGLNRAFGPKGEPLDFDGLADASEGIRRLGILRMDVDNLGTIFQRGLGEHATIADLAALSRHLTYFFGGYLSTLLKRPQYESKAQIIYSGGDDLFIVGAWSTMPQLANEIRSQLQFFAGSNPNVTISGGIVMTLPSLPVTVAAEQAADAEDAAKVLRPTKNAVTFFGEPFGWEEFKEILDLEKRLEPLFLRPEGGNLARTTLRNLYLIADSAHRAGNVLRKNATSGKADNLKWAVTRGKWAWQAAYALARGPRNSELEKIFDEMQDAVGPSVERPILALLKPATEWIDLLRREERNERTATGI